MTDVLMFADTERSPALRHELPLSIGDAFLYAEVGGVRHAVVSILESGRLGALDPALQLHHPEDLGADELREQGLAARAVQDGVAVEFCRRFGLTKAAVPDTFPLRTADALRAAGVVLEPQDAEFSDRRRSKTAAELAGVRRAQVAADAGMAAVAGLLARASDEGGIAHVDGAPLTSERLREALLTAFHAHDASADAVITAHGGQAAEGHHEGSGPIGIGEPVVVDIWPRDNATALYTDMTRTFVVGEPPAELVTWHGIVLDAHREALAMVRPGLEARDLHARTCDVIEAAGHPTSRQKQPGETLDHGFFHALGHGVGLEVHEAPALFWRSTDTLVAGDVLAIEPGLYRPGFGGVRLEDVVVVTEDGSELLGTFPYDLDPNVGAQRQ